MTARDGRVSKPPSRQRPSQAVKKGLARGERETKRVTSNGAARSTASFYCASDSFSFGGGSPSVSARCKYS